MKIVLPLLFCVLYFVSFSQVKFGVQVGYNQRGVTAHDVAYGPDYTYHTHSLPGFNAGAISSVPLAKKLSLQPCLLLTEKGMKEKGVSGFSGLASNTNLQLYYLHLPVYLVYSVVDTKKLKVLAGAGPYLSKGIRGKEKGNYNSYDSTGMPGIAEVNDKVMFKNDLSTYYPGKRYVKPWDVGYTIAAEVERNNWLLKLSYDLGVSKILGTEHCNRVFGMSVGHYFYKK